MDKRPFLFLILLLIMTSLACGLVSTPTPEPTPIPTITLAPVVVVVTEAPVETASDEIATAVLPTVTVENVEMVVPTEEPTVETVEPEIETPLPVVDGEVLGPGQQDSRTLTGGGEETYLIDGVKFMPRFVFAETADEIDLLLSVDGTEANFSGPGGSEVLVFTADDNGRFDLTIRNESEASGEYILYLYDAAQAVPGAVHQPNVALVAGTTAQFQVESRGGRPVLIFVDPIDQSDISVTIATAEGQTIADANYSGPGSAEAAFVLPLETTRYTVSVKEINNAPSQINVLLVPLE
ncbi:MAG: hypothetical protein IAF02_25745 [Anaerolineae bacterium]|nr:hypothetical protein [Anaerolineae bacterium]